MRLLIFLILLCTTTCCFAQDHNHAIGRKLIFPDIPGYKTLKCDLHQHTVFSDGSVWPDIRVAEALMDGLDVISLTEHLEYQPHKDDIPHPDRNRSYNIAIQEAKSHDLLVVKGSEITRRMPPGHCNAVFISDPNKLLIGDSIEIFREAKRQGAFIFWNHPNWTPQRRDGIATLTDVHRLLLREKLLDGIEVVNDQTYSDEALQIALDNNLTIMGNSDIHKLIDWDFKVNDGGHRPVTLVFSTDKTETSVKDALFNRRTVVSYKDLLIGRNEYLVPLIQSSLVIKSAKYMSARSDVLTITVENKTNVVFTLRNAGNLTFHSNSDVLTIKPGDKNIIEVKTIKRVTELTLEFEVLNAINAPKRHPNVSWKTTIME